MDFWDLDCEIGEYHFLRARPKVREGRAPRYLRQFGQIVREQPPEEITKLSLLFSLRFAYPKLTSDSLSIQGRL